MEAPVSLNCSLNHTWQKLAIPELTVSQLPLVTTTSSSLVDIESTANDLYVILDG